MTLVNAIDIFKQKYSDKKPNGYWKYGDGFILNTDSVYGAGYSGEICQYIVLPNGSVQPTNPMRSEIIIDVPMIVIE